MNLRKAARGEPCEIRSSVCQFDPEKVCLCHVRMIGITGMGLKAPDFLGAHGCYACHTLCDTGSYNGVEMTREDRELVFLRGVMRTQAKLIKNGVVVL